MAYDTHTYKYTHAGGTQRGPNELGATRPDTNTLVPGNLPWPYRLVEPPFFSPLLAIDKVWATFHLNATF